MHHQLWPDHIHYNLRHNYNHSIQTHNQVHFHNMCCLWLRKFDFLRPNNNSDRLRFHNIRYFLVNKTFRPNMYLNLRNIHIHPVSHNNRLMCHKHRRHYFQLCCLCNLIDNCFHSIHNHIQMLNNFVNFLERKIYRSNKCRLRFHNKYFCLRKPSHSNNNRNPFHLRNMRCLFLYKYRHSDNYWKYMDYILYMPPVFHNNIRLRHKHKHHQVLFHHIHYNSRHNHTHSKNNHIQMRLHNKCCLWLCKFDFLHPNNNPDRLRFHNKLCLFVRIIHWPNMCLGLGLFRTMMCLCSNIDCHSNTSVINESTIHR